jgi:predicted GNAT family acetyltransferase
MLGNLEQMGIGYENLFYWGCFADCDLIGVIMRYKSIWHFYDAGGADLDGFARLVDAYPGDVTINGRPTLVTGVFERVHNYDVKFDHDAFYCALSSTIQLPAPLHPTRRATVNDIPALVRLYATAGEMKRDVDSIRGCLAHNRIYVTEVSGEIVSASLSNVETSRMAMVGGVFTLEPVRNRGYASAALTALCASLIQDGIQPCLFYDDPAAGKIYRRLGFEDIGPWRMIRLQHKA